MLPSNECFQKRVHCRSPRLQVWLVKLVNGWSRWDSSRRNRARTTSGTVYEITFVIVSTCSSFLKSVFNCNQLLFGIILLLI